MSDNMEREKNERLTTREIEEEEAEMRRELSGMGMYEPGYTYKDMKAILGFISESKDMAKMGAESKNAQKESLHSSNSYKSEDIAKIASPQETESKEHIELPKASYSYRTGHVSPTAFDRISTCGSSSPDSVMYELKSSVNRRKNTDRDEAFDCLHDNAKTRDTRGANKYMTLSPHNVSQDSQSMSSTDTKVDAQLEHSQLLDRWRIDPFDVPVCENDVPLQGPRRRPVHERVPFRQCREAQTPEKREKTIIELSAHMKEIADLWHSWHRTTDPKFQWGSPIQVGTANGSLDRNPSKETDAEHDCGDTLNKDSHGRVYKRKAPVAITFFNTKTGSTDDDDDDNDNYQKESSAYGKRRKAAARFSKTLRSSRVDFEKPSSSRITDEAKSFFYDDDDDDDTEPEPEDIAIVSVKSGRTENKSCSPSSTYPRRIIPPNPRANRGKKLQSLSVKTDDWRMKNNSAKFRKTVEKESDRQRKPEKRQDDAEDESTEQTKQIELKPLPLKSLSVRLQRQCMILKEMEAARGKKSTAKKEEVDKRMEEEKKRREDFHKRQLLEIENERKKDFEMRRVEIEKGEKYSEMLQLKQKQCRVRLMRCQEAEEKMRLEKEEEDRLLADSDDEKTVASNVPGFLGEQTNCPICFATFPNDKIQMHAAECKSYEITTRSEKRNTVQGRRCLTRNNATSRKVMLECYICSTFKTSNSTDYEVHVNNCLQQKEREYNRSPETTVNVLGDLPNSPISCFRPISEQADSEINYKSQFPTSSKAYSNRKRKR